MIHFEGPPPVIIFPGDSMPGWAGVGAAGIDAGAWLLVPSVHSPAGLINEASMCAQEPALQKSKKA